MFRVNKIKLFFKDKPKNIIWYGVLSALFYLSFLSFNLLHKYHAAQDEIMEDRYLSALIIISFIILFYFYLKCFLSGEINKKNIKYIWGFFLIISIAAAFVLPIASTDFYTYIYRSRILSHFQQNPYIVPYIDFFYDPFYPILANGHAANTSIYGPLFVLMGGAISKLAGNSILLNIIFFKGLFLVLNIYTAYLILKFTKNAKAFFLYAWNPYIIFEILINSHNDIVIIVLFLLGLWLIYRNKLLDFFVGIIFISLSSLIKFYTVLALPFVVDHFARKYPSPLKKIMLYLSSFILFAIIFFLAYLPFWEGFDIFNQLIKVQSMISFRSSLFMVFTLNVLYSLGIENFYEVARIITRVIFVIMYSSLFISWFLKPANKDIYKLLEYTFFSFVAIFFILLTWFWPWYLIILIAISAIIYGKREDSRYLYITFSLTLFCIFQYMI